MGAKVKSPQRAREDYAATKNEGDSSKPEHGDGTFFIHSLSLIVYMIGNIHFNWKYTQKKLLLSIKIQKYNPAF